MKTLRLSANTLDKLACPRRYWYYRIAHRKSAAPKSGADAGSCLHAAFAAWNQGASVDEQERLIAEERDKRPFAFEEDWRTTPYLCDAMAQLRAELEPIAQDWKRLEVEKRGVTELGQIGDTVVELEYKRDVVIQTGYAQRWVCDLKTSMRDEQAEVKAFSNSGQFKAYAWSWNVEHADAPCTGVQPIRLIMRKPSRTGVPFQLKLDTPVYFLPDLLEEWHHGVMVRARELLARNPDNPQDWPMFDSTSGLCRNQWGCCEYIDVCTLAPGDRALKLSTDAFVDSDYGKA